MKRRAADAWRTVPLWLRLYLPVCALISLVMVGLACRMIAVSADTGVRREIAGALDRQLMLADALRLYADSLAGQRGEATKLSDGLLASAAANYARYYTDHKSFLAVVDDEGRTLFSSMSAEQSSAMGLDPAKDQRRSTVIRRIGTETVVFVSSWIAVGDRQIRLDYARSITDLGAAQRAMGLQIALWLSAGLSALAVGLYILIRRALRPLDLLSGQAKALAQGKLAERIAVHGDDEIGRLASDFNRMAEAVQTKTELLQRAVAEREAFIASLAHEVKTPLTSIMGYASLLQSCRLNEADTSRALSLIHSESKRLDDLSKKLLELFRLGGGRVANKQPLSVPALLDELVSISRLGLAAKGQTLVCGTAIREVEADRDLLLVLLGNLLENASKASDGGAVIRLDVYPERPFAVFRVADTGCGIDSAFVHDVFQPFFTADPARDKKTSGYGLGLSLCKAIAEAHGGTIRLESRLQEGTAVYVRLPAAEILQIVDNAPIEP